MKFARVRLVQIPRHVSLDGVQAECAHLLKPITQVFRHNAEVVQRAGKDAERLVIQQELVARHGEHNLVLEMVCE